MLSITVVLVLFQRRTGVWPDMNLNDTYKS